MWVLLHSKLSVDKVPPCVHPPPPPIKFSYLELLVDKAPPPPSHPHTRPPHPHPIRCELSWTVCGQSSPTPQSNVSYLELSVDKVSPQPPPPPPPPPPHLFFSILLLFLVRDFSFLGAYAFILSLSLSHTRPVYLYVLGVFWTPTFSAYKNSKMKKQQKNNNNQYCLSDFSVAPRRQKWQ